MASKSMGSHRTLGSLRGVIYDRRSEAVDAGSAGRDLGSSGSQRGVFQINAACNQSGRTVWDIVRATFGNGMECGGTHPVYIGMV